MQGQTGLAVWANKNTGCQIQLQCQVNDESFFSISVSHAKMNYCICEIPVSLGVLYFIWLLGHACVWPWSWSWGGSDWGELVLVDGKTLPLSWIWGVRKRGIKMTSRFPTSRTKGALYRGGDGGSGRVSLCVQWGHVLFKGIANRKWRHGSLILTG